MQTGWAIQLRVVMKRDPVWIELGNYDPLRRGLGGDVLLHYEWKVSVWRCVGVTGVCWWLVCAFVFVIHVGRGGSVAVATFL